MGRHETNRYNSYQVDLIKECPKCGKPGKRTLCFIDGSVVVKHVYEKDSAGAGNNAFDTVFARYSTCVLEAGVKRK